MIKLARSRLKALPAWMVVALACVLANPFCCHLLPIFDGFESSLPAQIDEAQQLCAGKPLKTVSFREAAAPELTAMVVAVLPHAGGRIACGGLKERPVRIVCLHGPPRHLVLGMLRI